MNHVWIVMQGDNELGTVEAVSRKGACHEAYRKFSIPPEKHKTVTVQRSNRQFFGVDPAAPGADETVQTEVSCDIPSEAVR